MCGRYTLITDLNVVAERFGAAPPPADWEVAAQRYNIVPTQNVIVVGDDGKRYMAQMRWGAHSFMGQRPSIGNRMINARCERLAEKPAFRNGLKRRRCIIPADGFYEWQKLGKVEQPVLIVLKSREPLGFASLWERWVSPDGKAVLSCATIATEAKRVAQEGSQPHARDTDQGSRSFMV